MTVITAPAAMVRMPGRVPHFGEFAAGRMDPKLLAWADGDISKINVDPAQRPRRYAKYGRPDVAAAA